MDPEDPTGKPRNLKSRRDNLKKIFFPQIKVESVEEKAPPGLDRYTKTKPRHMLLAFLNSRVKERLLKDSSQKEQVTLTGKRTACTSHLQPWGQGDRGKTATEACKKGTATQRSAARQERPVATLGFRT